MALEIPFLKKGKSQEQIKKEIEGLQAQVYKEEKALQDEVESKDPIAARMVKYKFLSATRNKKGDIEFSPGKFGNREKFEVFQHNIRATEFPEPDMRYRVLLVNTGHALDEIYFWFLKFFREQMGFDKTIKIIDTLASSVASSNFGNIQTRIAAQQNQASQYLKGISEMVKGLFQIVREIRVLDERLQYYKDSDGDKGGIKENKLSSEIVLKGLWVDQVEGGAKNPGSVYGLSQTIGFTILPDLFFRVQIESRKTLESDVDKLNFNQKVKEVLKRKLRQYYEWKWRTKKELETRRNFMLRYLKQHYNTIKLYMSWVKPYLRNLRWLQMNDKNMSNYNLVHSFETQLVEIESLFYRSDFNHSLPCMSLHIFFRGDPDNKHHPTEYSHKGFTYRGYIDITLRAYAWDHDTIKSYEGYRKDDDLDLLKDIDESVNEALKALGDDLDRYLKEADNPGIEEKKEETPKQENYGIFEPFVYVFKGFGEIFSSFGGGFGGGGDKKEKTGKKKKLDDKTKWKNHKSHHRAMHFAQTACWEAYYRFKMGPVAGIYWIE